jgi:hypothetical protein
MLVQEFFIGLIFKVSIICEAENKASALPSALRYKIRLSFRLSVYVSGLRHKLSYIRA